MKKYMRFFNLFRLAFLASIFFSFSVAYAIPTDGIPEPERVRPPVQNREPDRSEMEAPMRVLSGHSGEVYSVAFSPDGRMVAIGSRTYIWLWDIVSDRQHWDSESFGTEVAFSRDGRMVLSFGGYTMHYVDAASGRQLDSLSFNPSAVDAVSLSPNGKTVACGLRDGSLWLVSMMSTTGRKFSGHSEAVTSVSFSPDGSMVASGSKDNYIKIWDVESGREVRSFSGHNASVYSVAFSPDGQTIASADWEGTIRLWEVVSGRGLRIFSGHTYAVFSIAFSPDGRTLVSGSADKTVKLWDVTSGKELRTISGHANMVKSVAFSPDGRILASGSTDTTVRLWNVADVTERK